MSVSQIRIGLVTEGPTDQVIIKELLTAYARATRPDVAVSFNELQPNPDRTSSNREGGWEMVYKWCLNTQPAERRNLLGRGLFAHGMDALQCDVIVVHMDADICEKIGDKSAVVPVPTSQSKPNERGAFIRQTLLEWLWPEGEEPDEHHIPAPAVEACETWLVAPSTDEPEHQATDDIFIQLVAVEAGMKGRPVPADAKQIRKSVKRYHPIAKAVAGQVAEITRRCPHFAILAKTVFPAET